MGGIILTCVVVGVLLALSMMADGDFFTVRIKEGSELPDNVHNRHSGQWEFDSRWYPQAGALKPGQSVVLPEGVALAGERFFSGPDGTSLLELEAYDGPTDPGSVAAAKLVHNGQEFDSIEDLKDALRREIEGDDNKSRAPITSTPNLEGGSASDPKVVDDPDEQKKTKEQKMAERKAALSLLSRDDLAAAAKAANVSAGGANDAIAQRIIDAEFAPQ